MLGTLGEKQDEQTRNLSGRFEELAGSLDKVQQLLGREAGLLESVRDGLDQSESFKSALEPLKGALDHALGVNTQSLQTMEQVLSAIEESGVKESDSARSIREAIEQLAKLADDQRRLLNGLSEEGREGRDVASRSATLLDEIRNQSGRMVDALEGQRLVMDGIQSESSQMKGRMGTYTQTAEEGFGSLERVLTSLLQNSRQGDEILDTLAQRQEESLQTQKALLEQMRDQAREDRRDRELMQQTLSQLTDAMRQVSKRSGGSGDSDKRGFFARLFG